MEYSRQYNRTFITLEEDRSDYSIDAKGATGRCVIEIRNGKGKVQVYVQGLKPEVLYKAYIISGNPKQSYGLPIGLVPIDSTGRGEIRYEFEPDNVAGSGFLIEQFNVVAVLVQKPGEIIAPLVGFSGAPVIWKNNFSDYTKMNKNIEEPQIIETVAEEPVETENAPEDIAEEIYTEQEIVEDLEQNAEEVIVEKEDLEQHAEGVFTEENVKQETVAEQKIEETVLEQAEEEPQEAASEDLGTEKTDYHETFRLMATRFREEMKELNYYKNLTKEDADNAFRASSSESFDGLEYMFLHNTEMQPFQGQLRRIKWIGVYPEELAVLDGDIYKYIYSAFVNAAHKRYKHLILGRYEEVSGYKYVLGVPGVYGQSYKLQAQGQGFRQFKGCGIDEETREEYGYWLMFI